MNKQLLEGVTNKLNQVTGHTRWNELPIFTPAVVASLLAHIEECHGVLRDLAETNAYEYPYRCPVLITRALDVLGKVA